MRSNVRNRRLVCAAFVLSTLAPVPAAARVYKWIDEKGQVHVEGTPPPIDYEWADRAGFYYNRDKVPGKELNHVRPRPAAVDATPGKPGAPRPGASSGPGEAAYRRVEGLIAQAERQALAFDEAENRNRTSSTSSVDTAWTSWQRGFAAQIDQVEESVRADAGAPSSLGYALDSLRSLTHGGAYVPSRMTRESTVRGARNSLSLARAELDRSKAASRSAPVEPSPPLSVPAYQEEPHRVIVTAPLAMPSFAGLQGMDPNQAMAMAKTASMTASLRQAMAQVVMTGGCEGGYTGAPSTPGTWARKLVDDQNAAQRELAAEARKMMPPGAMAPEPVKFVYGAPTAPWQIAVIPDVGKVRVEAYGNDLKTPIQSESLPCGGP